MTDELTPWEEINPPMASAQRRVPQSQSLDDKTRETFRNELAACLALTAPAGMTEEGRRDWLTVAWAELKAIPPDILSVGAQAARRKCDHPSKIVPTIIAETADLVRWRRERENERPLAIEGPPPKKHIADRDRVHFGPADWEELNQWLEAQGAGARYHPDGTRYFPATTAR